jgi:hypothetical protein
MAAPRSVSRVRPVLGRCQRARPLSPAGLAPPILWGSAIMPLSWWSGAGRTAGLPLFRRIRGVAAYCWVWPGGRSSCGNNARCRLTWRDVCRRWLPVWLPHLVSTVAARQLQRAVAPPPPRLWPCRLAPWLDHAPLTAGPGPAPTQAHQRRRSVRSNPALSRMLLADGSKIGKLTAHVRQAGVGH